MTERLCLYCEGDNYRDSDFCCDACEDNYNDDEAKLNLGQNEGEVESAE